MVQDPKKSRPGSRHVPHHTESTGPIRPAQYRSAPAGSRTRQWTLAALLAVPGISCAATGAGGLRDLEADRPDATESPITVDRGRFQIEASFFSYTRDERGSTETESLGIAESNVKYGLLDSTDLQLVFTPYVRETVETPGTKTTVEDFSDLTFRVKYNVWGNDGGDTALGVMPFVKVPTDTDVSNGRWEGGVIVPFAWQVGERWGIGLQGEVDRVYNEADDTMDWDFAHTAVAGFDITEELGVYLEYFGIAGDHPYEAYLSSGATYDLTPMLRLDAGTLIGLNEDSDDFTVFSGVTWKF